ncbi:MAG TPA: Crp/Fnr family transcriptional regulator [Ramlibacter sp.]|jgi:CRP/FNR family cyclic AMP-dependent transcriptional regulator|nr:Crp/Fnr family transcriptional regulator [Ramlibacter sp.]
MEALRTAPAEQPEGLALLREHVLARGQARSYRANTIVAQEGEPADCMYWVLSGELVVYVDDPEGKVLELNRLLPGDYFGELILASAVRTASVRTLTECRLCRIQRPALEELLTQEPKLALEIIRMLSERLVRLTGQVRSIALASVYSRVREFLEQHALSEDGAQVVQGVSQQGLAEQLGASKSMVNRVLKDLETGGYIRLSRRCVTLLRPLPKAW